MGAGRIGKAVAVFLAVCMATVTAGCYGKFQLTRNLYDVNRSVDDQYVRSVLTWILIIPYAFTGLLDFLVFNVIEFWSGQNPIAAAPVTKEHAEGAGKAVLTLSRDGAATTASIARYEGGVLVSTLRIRDDGRGTVTAVETAGGRKVREATAVSANDGSVELTVATAAGAATEHVSSSAVRSQIGRVARIAAQVRQAARPAGGTMPLAAAPTVPAFGG
ncbi:MAG: DUF3332 family protein [Verrucomicrobiota bacterium]